MLFVTGFACFATAIGFVSFASGAHWYVWIHARAFSRNDAFACAGHRLMNPQIMKEDGDQLIITLINQLQEAQVICRFSRCPVVLLKVFDQTSSVAAAAAYVMMSVSVQRSTGDAVPLVDALLVRRRLLFACFFFLLFLLFLFVRRLVFARRPPSSRPRKSCRCAI